MIHKTAIFGVIIGVIALGLTIPFSALADVPAFIHVIVKDKDGNPIEGVVCEIVGVETLFIGTDETGHDSSPLPFEPAPDAGTYVLKCKSKNFNGSTFITIPASGDVFVEITVAKTKKGN